MKNSSLSIFILFLLGVSGYANAQELNCQVAVEAIQIESTERRVFDEMEVEFAKFLNDRKWADERFENNERINCGINITLESQPSLGNFQATVQVVSARPVFNSTYDAVMINYADRDFDFEYTESQPLDFQPTTFMSNITSILGFYAYMIIANDYDSFEKLGGQRYYEAAWQVVSNAQQSGYSGWDQFNSVRNRYWWAENSIDQVMEPMREAMYEYHIKGLDMMADNPEEGRTNILAALKKVQEVNRSKPRAIMVISFLDAKMDELVGIFSEGNMAERREVYNILKALEPAKTEQFGKILEN
ncbi:DUF4835 family protein [Reichenbachiella carrageenanivorans]|uniref:DUF4835 family protein n=1 Tax=Reichenbachiella carrageenanivorans TaxID=2979869 RepID=A0ABY6D0M1_9BACT|nr:DUF4835 family protein [Reichenbachiella carrageenanivorans]UXX79249.1 DUF4835 family protein [Reichenbachiella carrageenanivorans]